MKKIKLAFDKDGSLLGTYPAWALIYKIIKILSDQDSQSCYLLRLLEHIWLICTYQFTTFVTQCLCEKGTEIMPLLATLLPELQHIPLSNQFFFFF